MPVGADRITGPLRITPETDGKCISELLEHPRPCRELLGFQTGYHRGRGFRGHSIPTKASKSSVYGLQRQNGKRNRCHRELLGLTQSSWLLTQSWSQVLRPQRTHFTQVSLCSCIVLSCAERKSPSPKILVPY